jgi:hypothetical protein
MSRSNIIVTGLIGVMGAIFLTILCLFVVTAGWLNPPLSRREYVLALFLFLLIFSVLEIPVMVFALQRMVASVNPKAKYVAMVTNVAYTFFAAVYAAPFILLAGQTTAKLVIGVGLSALCLIRFISTVVFLPDAKQIQSQ